MKALQKFFAQKWFIYVVCTAIIFSSYSFAGLAMAQTSDIKGHWAEKQLEEWQNKGLLHGFSDGSLRPNSSITRAELAALMNRYFKFTVQKEIQFTDLVKNQWQYPELAKAAQAGYIEGYSDGTIRPDKQVSRQEVAVMLANVIKASAAAESDKSSFRDEADIAAWSKNAVRTLVAKGLISGYKDGTFRPQASLTRAEAVILLSRVPNAQSTVYDKAGTYGPATGMDMVMGDVIINVAGVTLQNTMVHGNLVLGKDIASGDVTLKNVKVEGTTTVSGGGEKSIHLLDTTLGKLVVNRENGVVRIVAELASSIQDTTVLSAAILEESSNLTGAGFINVLLSKGLNSTLSGTFKDLKIEATNMKIEILKGSVESVTVDGSGNTITLSKDASIVKLVVNALIKLLGSGKVSTATINEGGKGSSFEVAPTKVDGPQSGSIKGNSTGGSGGGSNTGGGSSGGGGSTGGGTGGNPDTSIPAAPSVIGVSEGQTYTSGVLPNWTDAVGTTSTATLNGAAYIKGNGITEAGEYTLVVTALKTSTGKTSKTTVKFKVDPAVKLIGYVNGETKWSEAKAIDATKLTHIDYAFTHILDNKLVPVEGNFYKDNYAYMKNLKKQNPNLKILNSVGGWAANGFSDAAFTPETREVFVKSIIDYIVKYDLDGIDLDWEYPTQTAGDTKGRPEDKQNFTLLLKLLREKLNALGLEHNKYYELSIAAGAGPNYLAGVEIEKIVPLLDNINIMTYDLAGGWVPYAAHHTNLYGNISVDWSVNLYLKGKVPANKIVIGAAFYSHMWMDVTSKENGGLGQPATGSGNTPTYNEILAKYNAANGYKRYWDDAAKAPYRFNGSTFISYDDPQSVHEKAKYVLDKKLGGAMFWEYSNDSTGTLLNSLANGLQGLPYVPGPEEPNPDNTVPAVPSVSGVSEGQTYTSGVLPNWTDEVGTTSTATLNGAAYIKGNGITEAGEYTLVVTALHSVSGKTSKATVKFKVDPAVKLIGYVNGETKWSEAKAIDATKLTHIDYAFTHILDNKLVPVEGNFYKDNYAYMKNLKKQNPNLKILNSVGGWAANGFSDAAFTPETREIFTKSIIDYIVKYDLDGIDLDWEYPTQTAGDTKGRPEDKQNFTLLLKLLREKLNALGLEHNKYYELSIAAGAGPNYLAGVEIEKIAPLLDNINIMTYDLAGGWVPYAAHHTNLYGNISVDWSVNLFLKGKVPANKIIIGAAFYSHMWTDVTSKENGGLGQPATGSGNTPTYNEILAKYNAANGYKRYWDDAAKAPYRFNGSTFISYDDPQSVHEKAKYVLDKKLGGAMFWEYSNDSTGTLLNSLANGLQGKPYVPGPEEPNPDNTVPAVPSVTGVSEGQTYTSGVLPNWTDEVGTTSTATLNGAAYIKGQGITEAGEYTLVVTALHNVSGKTSKTTVKFTVDPAVKLIGYVNGENQWSEAKAIDATKLTHIDYAFTHISNNQLVPVEGNFYEANYAYMKNLKKQNPNLKILNSVGGWAADGFSDAALTAESRDTFTKSIIDYIVQYDLDGIDLDWEYPTQTAGDTLGRPVDKENFTLLLKLLREKLNALGLEHNKYYELSIAAGAGPNYLAGVEIEKIAPLLDNINIMTYDLAGGWVPYAAHHTNLYGNISVDWSVNLFLKGKVPANKIVIGAAFYSHMWTDVTSTENGGLGQAATGSGNTPTYNDILVKYNAANGYKRYWDDAAKAPYRFNGSTFISYDDPQSLHEKAKYVLDKKLGGAMFWEYSNDSTGTLLNALADGIQGLPYVPGPEEPNPDNTVPAVPTISGVAEGQTYTSGVLPNWTDAASTTSTATLNGAAYTKGQGITEAGEYTLVVTALHSVSGKTSKATVKFTVDPAVKLIGYVNGENQWSDAKAIDATKLTHIDYAFTHISNNKLVPVEGNFYEANYAYMQNLKKQNPNLKILNSVGGWAADGFSDAALTAESRETFTKSIIDYIVQYDLDGIDLDWEYPTQTAGDTLGRPEDKENFTLLLKLLREKLNALGLEHNKYYELSIAAGAGPNYLAGVEIEKIAPLLDNINIMTYDLAGGWVPYAAHHTNLYGNISVDWSVNLFLKGKVPANKIVIGAAFYSHMWTDVTSKENGGLGQPATGSGNTPTYNDILVKYNAANGYKRYWDDAAKAPYLFNGSTFISYDDPQSLYEKAKYVLDKKLGGAMFWEYSNDSTGTLLNALADGLKGNSYEPEIQALEAPDASNEPQTNEDLETPEAVEVPVQ